LEVVCSFYENKKRRKESKKWREIINAHTSLLGNGGCAHPYHKRVGPDRRHSVTKKRGCTKHLLFI
jgi:hypothetical protein